jgi:hypothetical protein
MHSEVEQGSRQMQHALSDRKSGLRLVQSGLAVTIVLIGFSIGKAQADETGISFWLPGHFSSLAATPQLPGWSMAAIYYHTSVEASGSVAAAKQIQIGRFPANVNVSLNASLTAQADLLLLNPTYTFATPVLGGQLAIGITGIFGRANTSLDGTLTTVIGPLVGTRTGSISDSLTSVGDLYPLASLKWNAGVHNFMIYVTGDIPVGAYDPTRLSNLGIGHGAIDGGGGYTFFNPAAGRNSRRSRVLPTTSRIPTRSIKTASISTSTGASRSSSRNRFSSASSDTPINSSLTTSAKTPSLVDSGPALPESARKSATCSRSATCRAILI